MAIDPKAAAAAAQAAAEAARAAAEAAAEAAAIAEAERTTSASIPTSSAGQVLDDTGVDLGGELAPGVASLEGLRDQQSALADASRESLIGLPELDALEAWTGSGLTMPALDGGATGGAGAYLGKDAVSDGSNTDNAWIAPSSSIKDRLTGSNPMWRHEGNVGTRTHYDGTVQTQTFNRTNGTMTETYTDTDGHSETYFWVDGKQVGVQSDDGDPVWSTGLDAKEVTDLINEFFGGDSGSDGSTSEGEGEGGASGSSVSKPAPDEAGGYTGDWNGITPIGPGTGDDDLVAGATGNTGSSSGSGLQGPQGGGWAINPGAEGFVAGRETDLQDAAAWYGGVGDPGSPDLQENAGGNPQMLDQGIQVVDPETVNPVTGDAEAADAGAQASTAYRTIAAPAEARPAADAAATDLPDQAASGDSSVHESMSPADGPAHPDIALPEFEKEDDALRGMGHGRGREFGQEQGQGRGQTDEADDLGE